LRQQIVEHNNIGCQLPDLSALRIVGTLRRGDQQAEDVPDYPGATRSTALGNELKLDLVMAFVGAWDIWEIPYILVDYGYIEESQAEELCNGPQLQAERKLRWYVFRAYLKFCNQSRLVN
jgi:hypothetical protein